MAGKASIALFLAVNLVVFSLASACGGRCPTPTPSTPSTPTPTPAAFGKCPRDALKLGVCANVLGLIKAKVGVPPAEPCCPLLEGLVDLEAAGMPLHGHQRQHPRHQPQPPRRPQPHPQLLRQARAHRLQMLSIDRRRRYCAFVPLAILSGLFDCYYVLA
ncbi:hypothetical protein OsJ_15724 [Oryza sativa Japonica Group]|uniref:Hydrophobic seed protein domain-containing protein n=1 Tax=Oryza sativa subsp. japonica TaxID=39947 RepID=A3AW93_ORYSJ|nr:hypothetical protein OsJ_15724 [Oryza sativa Japonica Group]